MKLKQKKNLGSIILDWRKFRCKHRVIQKRLILYAIEKTIGHIQNIEKVNVDDIVKLCSNNVGNKYLTPNKNIKISVNNGKIYFISLK